MTAVGLLGIAAGIVLMYAGYKNKSPVTVARDAIRGTSSAGGLTTTAADTPAAVASAPPAAPVTLARDANTVAAELAERIRRDQQAKRFGR